MTRINLTNEINHFVNGDYHKRQAIASLGNKLQMSSSQIVQSTTVEDFELLGDLVEQIMQTVRLQRAGMTVTLPEPDKEYAEHSAAAQLQR